MADEKPSGIALLWKTEDWLAVWVGFLIIILMLVGLPVKAPSFTWATDGGFTTYIAKLSESDAVGKLEATAAEQKEAALQADLAALKAAMATGDRKAISAAGKNLEATAKSVSDSGLKKKAAKLGKDLKSRGSGTLAKVFSGGNLKLAGYILVGFLVLSMIAMALLGQGAVKIIAGFPIVFVLAWLSQLIAGNLWIKENLGIEYVLWCLFLGLFISNVLRVPDWLKPAVQTEFYIKCGLVILGSGILFKTIVESGFYGIVQAVLVVGAVWYFTWWVAKKLKVDEEFAAVLSSAVSICGVSAAIATGGAIKADSKKISYVTSIVLICAIPMMILQPIIAKYFGMSDVVAGAWLGGTLDTSGSVVAAGELISDTAMKAGVIVKMGQNVLIGVAAFVLSIIWTLKACKVSGGQQAPSAVEIWHRFPKFVLGFMVASILFSFVVDPATVGAVKGTLKSLRTWWFALAFTCIGLETKFGDLAKMEGGRPAGAFLIGQAFNIFWTLLLAWLLFGGVIFPVPNIQ